MHEHLGQAAAKLGTSLAATFSYFFIPDSVEGRALLIKGATTDASQEKLEALESLLKVLIKSWPQGLLSQTVLEATLDPEGMNKIVKFHGNLEKIKRMKIFKGL